MSSHLHHVSNILARNFHLTKDGIRMLHQGDLGLNYQILTNQSILLAAEFSVCGLVTDCLPQHPLLLTCGDLEFIDAEEQAPGEEGILFRVDPEQAGSIVQHAKRLNIYFASIANNCVSALGENKTTHLLDFIAEQSGISARVLRMYSDWNIIERIRRLLYRQGSMEFIHEGYLQAIQLGLQLESVIAKFRNYCLEHDFKIVPEASDDDQAHTLTECGSQIRFDRFARAPCQRSRDVCISLEIENEKLKVAKAMADREINSLEEAAEELLSAVETREAEIAAKGAKELTEALDQAKAREMALTSELGIAKAHVKRLIDKSPILGLKFPINEISMEEWNGALAMIPDLTLSDFTTSSSEDSGSF